MRRWLLLMACLALAACTPQRSGLVLAGSTSVQPLVEVLAEEYARQGGPHISIQGGGSTAGVQAVRQGVASLGAISRRLAPEETRLGLVEHIIAYDVLTVVVHPDNPVRGLTREQLRRLFSGEITDWAQLGGRPGEIHVVTREAGSGSREAFRQLVGPVSPRAIVLDSSGAIRLAVREDPQAIGYVNLGTARGGRLKALPIDGREPGAGGYPLVRPLSLVTAGRPGEAAERFLRFVWSPAGQRLVSEEGLVPVGEVQAQKR